VPIARPRRPAKGAPRNGSGLTLSETDSIISILQGLQGAFGDAKTWNTKIAKLESSGTKVETQPVGDATVEAPPTGGSSQASSYAITPTPFDTTEKWKADIMWDNGRLFEAQRLVDHFKASEASSPDGSKRWRRSLTKNSRDLEDLTENNRKREKNFDERKSQCQESGSADSDIPKITVGKASKT